jgi:hypothetical protein
MITAETFNQVMAVVRKDLDPATVAIVEDLLHNGERLLVIRDAFLEERDALAVKMIRDLDPNRNMSLLPISVDLRNRPYSQPEGVVTNQAFQITARPQRWPFRPRYLLLARETAEAIDINDIRVGNRSQTEQAGDVPGEMFAVDMPEASLAALDVMDTSHYAASGMPTDPTRIYTLTINAKALERLPLPIDFEPVQSGMQLVIMATNVSDKPLARFRGAFIGTREDNSY